MMTLEKFEEASEVVKNVILPTNLIYSEYYSAQTGGKIYLKPENMQYTGAYKVRGAYYKISTLSLEGTDYRIGRKSCAGSCLCSEVVWCKGSYRYAEYDTPDQGKPYEKLWCRGGSSRGCL